MSSDTPPGPSEMDARILVTEDEPITRRRLVATLRRWGYEVEVALDGEKAWEAFQAGGFQVVVTDWMMPGGVDGLELCRRIRAAQEGSSEYAYLILLTGRDQGLVEGMEAGADDFIAKPFRSDELRLRLEAALRLVTLKAVLARRVQELEEAMARVQRLEGLLPICSYCKNIRDEKDSWQSVERYVSQRSEASFSHSICPTCYREKVLPMLEEE